MFWNMIVGETAYFSFKFINSRFFYHNIYKYLIDSISLNKINISDVQLII